MIANTGFNNALAASGLSMYALAKRSGVPYTTINELHNGKNDINQCAAATVWRLAAALGVAPDEVMNQIYYLDGIGGRYKGIDYTWSTGETSRITFEYQGEPVVLEFSRIYNIPARLEYYNIAAELMIQSYIRHTEWKQELESIARGLAR